jgi:hypothetical protein
VVANIAKALLIALMLLAVCAAAQSYENAYPDCARRLLQQKAIEHGHHHQPTTAQIACKLALKGQSSPGSRQGAPSPSSMKTPCSAARSCETTNMVP